MIQKEGSIPLNLKFDFLNAIDADEKFAELGLKDFNNAYAHFFDCHLIFDDIGSEKNLKNYGQDGIIASILDKRFKAFSDVGALTVATANISSLNDINEAYGARLLDRIGNMSLMIEIKGKSRRK